MAADICDLLVELSTQEEHPKHLDMPYDEFPYAEALCRWEDENCNPRDFFTTDDPFLLHYRNHLVERFGLRILTEAESIVEKEYRSILTFRVTGIPKISNELN